MKVRIHVPVVPIMCIAGLMSFISWGAWRIHRHLDHNARCDSYIIAAAMYKKESSGYRDNMDKAMSYLDSRGVHEGSTAVFYPSYDSDVGWWRRSVENGPKWYCRAYNDAFCYLDDGKVAYTATYVKSPDGISIYPYNLHNLVWVLSSILSFIGFGIWWIIQADRRNAPVKAG